jgi:hypothetical protein
MSQGGGDDEDAGKTEMKKAIEELDFQGEKEALRRLTEESKTTLEYQIQSLDDIDSKAISVLRVNVLLIGLLFTAASFVADSSLTLSALDNPALYVGILSLLLSSAVATLTYTASDSEVGIEEGKIGEVIESDLTEKEFELAVAHSHRRWIWFNNRTNVLNAPLITLTNIFLIIGLSHLGLGAYLALDGSFPYIAAIGTWALLIGFIAASSIVKQVNMVREVFDLAELKPW